MFTASLHTHVRSLFDAQIEPNELCAKIKELGGKGCAITDHGVLSSIEDYKPVFQANDLKLIPGVELYVDGDILGRLHLILLAVDDLGYKTIGKIVTESNKNLKGGYPITTVEILKQQMQKNKGHVICLSACMQGVISAIFLQNEEIDKQIKKLQKQQGKYLCPSDKKYFNAQEELEKAEKRYADAILERDELKACAEQPFKKRETAVAKLVAEGNPTAEAEVKRLNADKAEAAAAKLRVTAAVNEVADAKKALSATKKKTGELAKEVEKYLEYEEKITELSNKKESDDVLFEQARKTMAEYRDIFGEDCFFAEIQNHEIAEEAECFPKVVKVARQLNVPVVATNDVHILNNTKEDRLRRQILRSLRFGTHFCEEEQGDAQLFLKTDEQMKEMLIKIIDEPTVDEAISNIGKIFDRCNVEFKTEKHYPKYSQTENADDVLDREIQKGIQWRFPEGMDKTHTDRLQYEVGIIKSMGYADYHLVVKDFLEYGRLLGYVPDDKIDEAPLTIPKLKSYISKNGWSNGGLTIGPGRGSAVGSLVCYLLGITNLDPLNYGLLFERFLNPERVSMPDIDSDIYSTGRSKVIDYVRNKYGQNSVCGIMTMTSQGPKGALRIAAKYYGYKKSGEPMTSLGDILAKSVPNDVGTSFATIVNESGKIAEKGISVLKYLQKKFAGNDDALKAIEWAKTIEGLFTAYGAHAAGVVISDGGDVSEYLPLRMNTELNMMTTQCDKEQVEENGLLKFDFLGLKTLDIITQTIRLIEKNTGTIINPLNIDLNDADVYAKIFSRGKTNSVFQFESSGMKGMLKRFKPESFEDLIILVSMFRPGPLQYLDNVIAVKNGEKAMEFLCPELEPILEKTYGAIVYQEQVMQICQSLAGFTLGHADQVRRYMSKKKADKLEHEREAFVNGCGLNMINADIASTLFDQMMDFASYAFNKSHAAAYAYNAYLTAWFKLYYPAEFYTAALNWAETKKYPGLMNDIRTTDTDVEVKSPDINESGKNFETNGSIIRFGLASIAGVKNNAEKILETRQNGPFTSLIDFLVRTDVNERVTKNLISAGAFDRFSDSREGLKSIVDKTKEIIANLKKKQRFVKAAEFLLPQIEHLKSDEELQSLQKEHGFGNQVTKLTTAEKLQARLLNAQNAVRSYEKDLAVVRETVGRENRLDRMNAEKELLGIYLTEHPMDLYPAPQKIHCTPIDEADTATSRICGIVTNLAIKARKKDGEKMAFFELEDKTGTISVSCFTDAYSQYMYELKDDAIVCLEGKTVQEEGYGDNNEVVLKFVVKKVSKLQEKKRSYMITTDYAQFHIDAEQEFKKQYAVEDGNKLYIHDYVVDQSGHVIVDDIRVATYCVSDKILNCKGVEEVMCEL